MFVCLSVLLSVCLSVCLIVYQSVYLYLSSSLPFVPFFFFPPKNAVLLMLHNDSLILLSHMFISKRNIGLAINSLMNASFMFHLKYTASKISIMLIHRKYVYVWNNSGFFSKCECSYKVDLQRFSVQIWTSLAL